MSTCTRAGNMVFVSGMPPFDPETGEILVHAPFERQVELILEQVKKALEAAGFGPRPCAEVQCAVHLGGPVQGLQRSLQALLPEKPPSRIFFCVPEWTGPFDVEVDCVAVTKD